MAVGGSPVGRLLDLRVVKGGWSSLVSGARAERRIEAFTLARRSGRAAVCVCCAEGGRSAETDVAAIFPEVTAR